MDLNSVSGNGVDSETAMSSSNLNNNIIKEDEAISSSAQEIINGHESQMSIDEKRDSLSPKPKLQVKDTLAMMPEKMSADNFGEISNSLTLQQMIQSHLRLSPHQLQALLQQQHLLAYHQQKELMEAGRKQLEQLMQMNLLQQAQVNQQPEMTKAILEQLHLSQDALAASQSHNSASLKTEFEARGRGVTEPSSTLLAALGASKSTRLNIGDMLNAESDSKRSSNSSSVNDHPLYSHGICRWTGCEASFDSVREFSVHLSRDHVLDERSTAQTRVQVQIVSQLEQQLRRERERLEAMMEHLHPSRFDSSSPESAYQTMKSMSRKSSRSLEAGLVCPPLSPVSLVTQHSEAAGHHNTSSTFGGLPTLTPKPSLSQHTSSTQQHHLLRSISPGVAPRKIQDERNLKNDLGNYSSTPHSLSPRDVAPTVGRCSRSNNVDPENEITRNRDFYRTHDVRPPFTYAALIRQAIIESPDRQLTLNEIYTWFQNTFAFFRRNAATWKNAVRHNLSLHKCFMRVENVKGAVWTVDEVEYHRRRPQRGTGANSGSVEKSPNAYIDSYESGSQGGSLGISINGEYSLNGLSLDQQAAYLQGMSIQFQNSFHKNEPGNSGRPINNNDDVMKIEIQGRYESISAESPRSCTGFSPRSNSSPPSDIDRVRHNGVADRERENDMEVLLSANHGNRHGDEEKAEDLSRTSNGRSLENFESKFRFHPYKMNLHMKPEQET